VSVFLGTYDVTVAHNQKSKTQTYILAQDAPTVTILLK
jgi:hypothetical protein